MVVAVISHYGKQTSTARGLSFGTAAKPGSPWPTKVGLHEHVLGPRVVGLLVISLFTSIPGTGLQAKRMLCALIGPPIRYWQWEKIPYPLYNLKTLQNLVDKVIISKDFRGSHTAS